ncbi:hypothetical protein BN903_22 [Halorubrum sp. AJ67]|nr:hypothetical protein BN903_22 [Halorubrum sp. AJ67]
MICNGVFATLLIDSCTPSSRRRSDPSSMRRSTANYGRATCD